MFLWSPDHIHMIIAQVCLRLVTTKGHSKMCSFITQHNATDVTSFEGALIDMLTAGMSTRAVVRELNVHFSTISRLQRRVRDFGSTSNRPHNQQTTCNHTSPGPPHPASSPPRSSETKPPRQLLQQIGLHNQRISAQNCQKQSQGSSSACWSSSSGSRPDCSSSS